MLTLSIHRPVVTIQLKPPHIVGVSYAQVHGVLQNQGFCKPSLTYGFGVVVVGRSTNVIKR